MKANIDEAWGMKNEAELKAEASMNLPPGLTCADCKFILLGAVWGIIGLLLVLIYQFRQIIDLLRILVGNR